MKNNIPVFSPPGINGGKLSQHWLTLIYSNNEKQFFLQKNRKHFSINEKVKYSCPFTPWGECGRVTIQHWQWLGCLQNIKNSFLHWKIQKIYSAYEESEIHTLSLLMMNENVLYSQHWQWLRYFWKI